MSERVEVLVIVKVLVIVVVPIIIKEKIYNINIHNYFVFATIKTYLIMLLNQQYKEPKNTIYISLMSYPLLLFDKLMDRRGSRSELGLLLIGICGM